MLLVVEEVIEEDELLDEEEFVEVVPDMRAIGCRPVLDMLLGIEPRRGGNSEGFMFLEQKCRRRNTVDDGAWQSRAGAVVARGGHALLRWTSCFWVPPIGGFRSSLCRRCGLTRRPSRVLVKHRNTPSLSRPLALLSVSDLSLTAVASVSGLGWPLL